MVFMVVSFIVVIYHSIWLVFSIIVNVAYQKNSLKKKFQKKLRGVITFLHATSCENIVRLILGFDQPNNEILNNINVIFERCKVVTF